MLRRVLGNLVTGVVIVYAIYVVYMYGNDILFITADAMSAWVNKLIN